MPRRVSDPGVRPHPDGVRRNPGVTPTACQRPASGVRGSKEFGSVSTRGITVFIPVLSALKQY